MLYHWHIYLWMMEVTIENGYYISLCNFTKDELQNVRGYVER